MALSGTVTSLRNPKQDAVGTLSSLAHAAGNDPAGPDRARRADPGGAAGGGAGQRGDAQRHGGGRSSVPARGDRPGRAGRRRYREARTGARPRPGQAGTPALPVPARRRARAARAAPQARQCPHTSTITTILHLLAGNSPGADAAPGLLEPLSHSEIRVLRYLPTKLSAPEIADQLYLSVNTVKTHMQHLYDKLGVHRRHEAVERARTLGLLAPAPHLSATDRPS
jgi:DNA-binding CsgD family transcriptional regulator